MNRIKPYKRINFEVTFYRIIPLYWFESVRNREVKCGFCLHVWRKWNPNPICRHIRMWAGDMPVHLWDWAGKICCHWHTGDGCHQAEVHDVDSIPPRCTVSYTFCGAPHVCFPPPELALWALVPTQCSLRLRIDRGWVPVGCPSYRRCVYFYNA